MPSRALLTRQYSYRVLQNQCSIRAWTTDRAMFLEQPVASRGLRKRRICRNSHLKHFQGKKNVNKFWRKYDSCIIYGKGGSG